MYESFYGLRKRPFAAAPDADAMVETAAVSDAIARIDRCVRQGRGVGVMTAAAGLGKTQLCHHFVRRLSSSYRVAMLPNASFPVRRGFLQAILAELDQPFQKLGETELRLELTALAKSAQSDSSGVVLILDEAHRYSAKILDEVRLIANLIENGEPLIRVVLSGQTELEDRLAEPGLTGLNERVGELVSLNKLTAAESAIYLRERTLFAGGSLESLFDTSSVALIVRACGGVPRCLNQLADHALLLGYVAERRPVDESLVREALDDLKRLPLQWHDPLPDPVDVNRHGPAETFHNPSTDANDDVIEIGGLMDDGDAGFEPRSPVASEPDDHCVTRNEHFATEVRRSERPSVAPSTVSVAFERPATEPVLDRFAKIDAAERRRQWLETLECSTQARSPVSKTVEPAKDVALEERAELASTASSQIAVAAPEVGESGMRPSANPLDTLDRIVPLLAELEADFGSTATRGTVSRRVDGGTARIADARAELERLVTTLENGAASLARDPHESRDLRDTMHVLRPTASAGPARPAVKNVGRSTLFSDLRRKQNEASSD